MGKCCEHLLHLRRQYMTLFAALVYPLVSSTQAQMFRSWFSRSSFWCKMLCNFWSLNVWVTWHSACELVCGIKHTGSLTSIFSCLDSSFPWFLRFWMLYWHLWPDLPQTWYSCWVRLHWILVPSLVHLLRIISEYAGDVISPPVMKFTGTFTAFATFDCVEGGERLWRCLVDSAPDFFWPSEWDHHFQFNLDLEISKADPANSSRKCFQKSDSCIWKKQF